MFRSATALLTVLLSTAATAPRPAVAQAAIGVEFAAEISASIVGYGLNLGLESLFGTGKQPGLTPEELAEALDRSFAKASEDEITVDVGALQRELRTYIPHQSYEVNANKLSSWQEDTAQIQADVVHHISPKNFLRLVPQYVTASNARLMLMGEIMVKETNLQPEDKELLRQSREAIAGEAEVALTELRDFYFNDFFDPGLGWKELNVSNSCVSKAKDVAWLDIFGANLPNELAWSKHDKNPAAISPIKGGEGEGSGAKKNPRDISTRWCPAADGVNMKFPTKTTAFGAPASSGHSAGIRIDSKIRRVAGHTTYVQNIGGRPSVGKTTRGGYSVFYKTGDGEYFYDILPNKKAAKRARSLGSADAYQEFGSLSTTAKGWLDLVEAYGTDDQIEHAREAAAAFVKPEMLSSN